jgi:DNA polymerase-3 subunit epsilon
MRYLSIDIEATGLDPDCLVIEFAMIPFDTETGILENDLAYETLVSCPSFESLKPSLNPWVVEHNQTLIENAHSKGVTIQELKDRLEQYFNSREFKSYFNNKEIVIFGKSLSAIDLPFLTRDFGKEFMNKFFSHKTLDLTCFAYGLIDMGKLPKGSDGSSGLMKFLNMGEVSHTALDDAKNTALMYLELLRRLKKS